MGIETFNVMLNKITNRIFNSMLSLRFVTCSKGLKPHEQPGNLDRVKE